MVPPRFATPREPGRRTLGPAVGRVSRALGRPLMPWQQYVADVGGEVDERGLPVYKLLVVTVPRQSGKTTLDLAQSVQRCLAAPNRKVWHTAQTGLDARKKWRELAEDVTTSPLRELVAGKPRYGAGAESLTFVNGSVLKPHPPTRDALHGEQSDLNNIDEAWSFDELHGGDLFQAIGPTQLTRPGAQTWIWSTRGDRSSTWFHGLIARGYARERGVAVFDWGIPDDADPTDLDVIEANHPAVGYTATRDSLESAQVALADKPGEFARAYGNRATGAGERILPLDPWNAARTDLALPAGRPAYGVAVAGDGSAASVWAAVLDTDGRPWVEQIAHRPGRSWAVEFVTNLRDAGEGVAIDRNGPAAPVADQLELAGVELLPLEGRAYAAGCQDVYDRITDPGGPRLFVRDPIGGVDDAADIAGKRMRGDGGWVWSRARSAGNVAPLEGLTLAAWAVLRNPPAAPAPLFVFG